MLLKCPQCHTHHRPDRRSDKLITKDGRYYRKSDRKWVQRYVCHTSNHRFSSASFSDCCRQNKHQWKSKVARKRLLTALTKLVTGKVLVKTDERTHYVNDIKKFFPNSEHRRFKGRRGCVVEQGRLKSLKGLIYIWHSGQWPTTEAWGLNEKHQARGPVLASLIRKIFFHINNLARIWLRPTWKKISMPS